MAHKAATPSPAQNQGSRVVLRRLDILLTALLVIIFIPLSIWGGMERWTNETEFLVLVLIPLGTVYAIIIGGRTRSVLLGAAAGILAGVMMYVPSTFFSVMENDIPGFIIVMAVFALMGTIAALISVKKRAKSASAANSRKGRASAAGSKKDDGVLVIGRDVSAGPVRRMLAGLAYAAGGILVSVLSYSAIASTGGVFFVAWGAILYGGVNFLAGLAVVLKKK